MNAKKVSTQAYARELVRKHTANDALRIARENYLMVHRENADLRDYTGDLKKTRTFWNDVFTHVLKIAKPGTSRKDYLVSIVAEQTQTVAAKKVEPAASGKQA